MSISIIRRAVATGIAVGVLSIAGTSAASAASTASAGAGAAKSAAAVSADHHRGDHRLPVIAVDWSAAWNSKDPQRLADLFVQHGARYTDHAFGTQDYLGRAGVVAWANHTSGLIRGAHIQVDSALSFGDVTLISWTFSGQVAGAPKPFSVPAVTVLRTRGYQIVTDDDYYDKADVLSQSGF
ncbi:nuclear transport factor 2 family protein [Catenulispora pinisilvae]|uniref:nuclear transport factor 2 family protein n=1 Tax=Catenulispora pinisilvae TaxID=2705253 RepID=UPI0018916A03|nr:nuclear transport factor 2 family protein [Catenulispora pinisilvae]